MSVKWVYDFSAGHAGMKELLGGKGANLAEMTRGKLQVPPGYTITTDACRAYYKEGEKLPEEIYNEALLAMRRLEQWKGQTFGDPELPLLVSVRSGSVTSMPGMMDTILNLGLNDQTVKGLAEITQNESFAYDCYRRLIQMYGNVVYGIDTVYFEKILHEKKQESGDSEGNPLPVDSWKQLIEQYNALIFKTVRHPFPQDVYIQLRESIEAVFKSWNNQRARVYRRVHHIPDHQGTAVNIQSMVFGNRGEDSGTGVVFSRNPSNGENVLYGEFLPNAQGEDVVSGARTPYPISEMEQLMPQVYQELVKTVNRLEQHYKDLQDIEFTIEQGKLYILQTRIGKRTAQAAVKIAVNLVEDGIISKQEAIQRIDVTHLDQLLHRAIAPNAMLEVLAKGLPASPGAASGQIVFDADTAEQWARSGKKVILVSMETTPEDIHGVIAAEGILTSRGGMTSHAAVVARGMGKPCVCGCESLKIDEENRLFTVDQRQVKEGDFLSIDGTTGRVIQGVVELTEPELSHELSQLLQWADDIRALKVLANADNPADAKKARQFGAQGVGLCRTEHMFMSGLRLPVVQEMILSESMDDRMNALSRLLPMQQEDFEGIFTAMDGLPVTVRLLDPPLHEFLPNMEELLQRQFQLSLQTNENVAEKEQVDQLMRRVKQLHEANPMMGLRGCRLGILFPEIYEMQAEAIFGAALACAAKGIEVLPEIMVPLVGHASELRLMRELIDSVANRMFAGQQTIPYKVGTMIEVPRAALTADQIAEYADFFSFGTNDLTQMTFGFSRDDAEGKFLSHYVDHKLIPANPFQVLDTEGVGKLIEWGVKQGRDKKRDLKVGICGEHGGDKESIFFCHSVGLNYVSCSPYRVPLARIAAAQAALNK